MHTKRLALLIGNSNYQTAGKLKNPTNDVDLMQDVLKKLGFKIKVIKNATKRTFLKALTSFGEELDNFDLGFFYFAGHGIQVDGVNYLLPIDASPDDEDEVEFDCIDANRVLKKMEGAQNTTNIIVLDACRNDPFKNRWSRSPSIKGLTYMSAPYGSLIAYSTAPNKTASDGKGKNSPYTEALAEEILTPNITIIQVLQKVRNILIRKLKGNQVPWESTSMLEDLILNDGKYTSLKTLCQSIQYNNVNDYLLNNLGLTRDDFEVKKDISKLYDPHGEEIVGVLESKNFSFEDFDNLIVRKFKNGEREFRFSFKTNKVDEVLSVSRELIHTLGLGIYDEKLVGFVNEEDVKRLVKGKLKNINTSFTMWFFDKANFSLSYSRGENVLLFIIRTKPYKEVVKGSLIKLLKNDYDPDSSFEANTSKTNIGYYVDYDVMLKEKEFDFFDKATIRIFYTDEKEVNGKKVFLKNSKDENLEISKVSDVVSSLASIYGRDSMGMGYLTGDEVNKLEKRSYWLGRSWHLNDQHQELDMDNAVENHFYSISINYEEDKEEPDYGLTLDITGYESLLKYSKWEGDE